jgi:riboflavin kinase / FMN adenylyltransferase
MKVHTDLASFKHVTRPVLTTGTFDGVHQGHQAILRRVQEVARREQGESVLFTFHPHPRMVLFPHDNELKLLNTPKEKIHLLEMAGVDHLLIVPFSRTFSRMRAVQYVQEVLVGALGVHAVVLGYDHRFGRNREGDLALLRQQGKAYAFRVEEIPAHEVDHMAVSSTKVREALLNGDVRHAAEWLGYPYPLTGLVVKGDQLGRRIGWPTANLAIVDPYKLVPGSGVYAVRVQLRNESYPGMLNIGVRPTVQHEKQETTVEVHIIGLDRDIYGELVSLRFVQRMRNEQRFAGVDELRVQLAQDKMNALAALA